jgi:hypothetical protein
MTIRSRGGGATHAGRQVVSKLVAVSPVSAVGADRSRRVEESYVPSGDQAGSRSAEPLELLKFLVSPFSAES